MLAADLARRAGISRVTLSRIENGHHRNIESKTLSAVATVLGVSADDLLPVIEYEQAARAGMAGEIAELYLSLDQAGRLLLLRDLKKLRSEEAGVELDPLSAMKRPAA